MPMISTVEELWAAKELIEQVRCGIRLDADRVPDPLPIGAMIEVPAAVLTLDRIAQEVDFLCVGTNDLIQYLLAVDRDNPKVSHLFQPLHPSILHCLVRIASTAKRLHMAARICGEMCANPIYAVLFLGMGFDQFSMNPRLIPSVRQVVRAVTVRAARTIADKAITLATSREIADFLIREVTHLVKADLSPFVKEILAARTGLDEVRRPR